MPPTGRQTLFLGLVFCFLAACSPGLLAADSRATAQAVDTPGGVVDSIRMHLENENCPLPCWFGIKLNETSISSVREAFEQLGLSEIEYETESGNYHDYSFEQTFFSFRSNDDQVIWLEVQIYLNSDSDLLETYLNFSTRPILQKYGNPENFLIFLPHSAEMTDEISYVSVLDYSVEGFLIVEQGRLAASAINFLCVDSQVARVISIHAGLEQDLSSLYNHWKTQAADSLAIESGHFRDEEVQDFLTFQNSEVCTQGNELER